MDTGRSLRVWTGSRPCMGRVMSDSTVYVEGREGDRGPLPPPFLHSFFIALAPLLSCSPTRCSATALFRAPLVLFALPCRGGLRRSPPR